MLGDAKLVMRGGFGIFYDIEDGALNLQFGGEAPFGRVTDITPNDYSGVTPGFNTIADPSLRSVKPIPIPPAGGWVHFRGSSDFICLPCGSAFPHTVFGKRELRSAISDHARHDDRGRLCRDVLSQIHRHPGRDAPLPSLLQQQLNNYGSTNPDCARPLAGCTNPTTDPNASPTGALQLFTDLSAGSSSSNQLQVTMDKRFSHGFNIRGAYTFAKILDNQSGFRYNSSVFTDPFNFAFDRGPANFDVRHRLVISGIWELPLDRPFRNGTSFMRKVLEGWETSGNCQLPVGTPFTIFSESNSSQEQLFEDRADQIGPNHIYSPRSQRGFTSDCSGGPGFGHFYFDPTAYDCNNVPILTFGNSPRNALRGPGRNDFDLTIGRTFKFGESRSIEFRSEFFNAFNHTQFFNPDHFGGDANFGQITQARDPRIIQLALKFYF